MVISILSADWVACLHRLGPGGSPTICPSICSTFSACVGPGIGPSGSPAICPSICPTFIACVGPGIGPSGSPGVGSGD